MKNLITITIISLLSFSTYASVGEGSTECINNLSTQARLEGKSKVAIDVVAESPEKPSESISRDQ